MRKYILVCLLALNISCGPLYRYSQKKVRDHYLACATRVSLKIEGTKYYVSGSGFAIDKDRVMTAGHVCADMIKVDKDKSKIGKTLPIKAIFIKNNERHTISGFKIMKIDTENDLCLLEKKDHGLRQVVLAKSMDVNIGDDVFTVGAPLAVFPVYTEGKVIDLDASNNFQKKSLFTTSVPVTGGNSGGFVVHNGKVIGVIVRGITIYTNISFAVKIDKIHDFLKRGEKNGTKSVER